MITARTTCDGCGCERGSELGWLLMDTTTKSLTLTQWDDSIAKQAEFHLCGQLCAQQKISQALTEISAPTAAKRRLPFTSKFEEAPKCTTK